MQSNKSKRLNLPLATALLFLLVGLFARINEWSLGFEMALLGFLIVGFVYGTRFSLKVDKTVKDRVKAYLVFLCVMTEVLSMLQIKSAVYFSYFAVTCGVFWLILESIAIIKKEKTNQYENPTLWVGLVVLICYVITRVLNWDSSYIPLLAGVFFTAIGFLVAHFQYLKTKNF